jgi:tetratricopeptide (TPR) repeat protein
MIGSLLNDRYRIDAELGRGGMGAVYRAHDTVLDRDVAVKLLSQSGLGTEGRERMLREAQAIAKLNHPNIVQVFDAGELDQTPFIVMELVEGHSLHEQPPRDFPGIVAVARQICTALEHAHGNGIIHRDLKPENVTIALDGSAKLMDFGLARSVASRMTSEGEITGTVFYLAPELALGRDFDGRADLYALGVMLYELTTGELPFSKGDPLTVISQHIHASAIPPRSKVPTIPPLLEQLIQQLMSKDPAERPESAAATTQLLESPSLLDLQAETDRELALLARIARGKFIGRTPELKQARSLWAQAVAGQGTTLLISGEPGIGKTRILRELATHVEVSGGVALFGEAYEGGSAPYAPFGEAIRRGLQRAGQAGLDLPQVILADLLALVPELHPYYPDTPPNPTLTPEAEQQRQFESVVAFFSSLSEIAPVLLALDDAHWADSGSLALLRHLARRTRRQRLLLSATYREVELDEARPLHEALLDLDRNRLATRLKLGRFTREETRGLLFAIFEEEITPGFLDGIFRETEGNPFFIEEVCKALVETGKIQFEGGHWHRPEMGELSIPQSVRMAIQSRVTALPETTQEVLRLAAVLGREFEYETLAVACELEEEALIDALESAQRAQLIEEINGGEVRFSFVHALIPTTVAEGVRTLRRRRLHRRAADAVRKVHPLSYEAIARHYEEAGDDPLSLEYYVKAGERAADAYANLEAEGHLRSALDLVEDPQQSIELLERLGVVLSRLGRFQEAIEAWRRGIELAREQEDLDEVAGLYALSARAAWEGGDPKRGLELAREGMQAVAVAPDSAGLADLYHETARALFFNGERQQGTETVRTALRMAEQTGATRVQVEAHISYGTFSDLPLEETIAQLERAAELAQANRMLDQEGRARNNVSLVYGLGLGRFDRTHQQIGRALETARETGNLAMQVFYGANVVWYRMMCGDLAQAGDHLSEVIHLGDDIGAPGAGRRMAEGYLAGHARYLGQRQAAAEALRRIHAAASAVNDGNVVWVTSLYLTELALESGEGLEAAEAGLLRSLELSYGFEVWPLSYLARVLSRKGDLKMARERLEQAQAVAQTGGYLSDRHFLALAEAEIALQESRFDDAASAFEQAAEVAAQCDMRWYRAHTLMEWAEAMIAGAAGKAGLPARAVLEEARSEFEAMGVPIYAEQIGARLSELGPG